MSARSRRWPWGLLLGGMIAAGFATGCSITHQGLRDGSPVDGSPDGVDGALDVIDVPPSETGDSGCGAGQVRCPSGCVPESPSNCGACGTACPTPVNGVATCTAGRCALVCNAGFADCDSNPMNGCEQNLVDNANCGGCGRACPMGQMCSAGASPSCSTICSGSTRMCGGVCVDVTSDSRNCGACGTACGTAPNGTLDCASSMCRLTCRPGFGDCDGMRANGCETDLNTAATHCGMCRTVCPPAANASPTCAGGACGITCSAGFADCNMSRADGCEVPTTTDPLNCGACGMRCTFANAGASCMASACRIGACAGTFRNCDAMDANGCETDTASSASNCGACGNACAAGFGCTGGVCDNLRVVQVTTGLLHTCALRGGGAVLCWGAGNEGRLGDGMMTTRLVPTNVMATPNAFRDLSAGEAHTCAVRVSGQAVCWGTGADDRLGVGDNMNRSAPTPVTGLTDATRIAAGAKHSCAVRIGGTVVCWGDGANGRLGNMSNGNSPVPVAAMGITTATGVCAGEDHSCALLGSGRVMCWGRNDRDQLGVTGGDSNVPVLVTGITTAQQITCGTKHTCAVLADGTARCWGHNDRGQIGSSTGGASFPVPQVVSGLTGVFRISAGNGFSCAVLATGAAFCWGENGAGQLGTGGTTSTTVPAAVMGLTDAVWISAGVNHACAARRNGAVACWGDNVSGQLGDGTMTFHRSPAPVLSLP